jgi:hypothetical protein
LSVVSSKFFTITSSKEETVKWSEIPMHLVKEIPLLRFVLKIAAAYPNADRNLNL